MFACLQAGLIEILHDYAYSNLRVDEVLSVLQSVLPFSATPLSAEDSSTVQQTSLGAWPHDQAYPYLTVSDGTSWQTPSASLDVGLLTFGALCRKADIILCVCIGLCTVILLMHRAQYRSPWCADGGLTVSQQAYVTYGPPDSDNDLSVSALFSSTVFPAVGRCAALTFSMITS